MGNRKKYARLIDYAVSYTHLYVVTEYVDLVAREYGIQEEDKAIIIKYYKCELIGQILDWMKDGMRYDIVKQFHRICSLFEGSTQIAFQRLSLIHILWMRAECGRLCPLTARWTRMETSFLAFGTAGRWFLI